MLKLAALAAVALATVLVSAEESNLRMHPLYETTSWELLEDMYLYHNAIRYFHNTPGLRFNRTLTDYARLKALILAWYDGDVKEEGGSIRFGENIHWTPNTTEVEAGDVVEDWYFNQEPLWNYEQPKLSPETRNFAQMVWNSTLRFGCGQAVSEGAKGGTYTVCYYDPEGSIDGLEAANVFAPSYPADEEGQDEDEARRDAISFHLTRAVPMLDDGQPLAPIGAFRK